MCLDCYVHSMCVNTSAWINDRKWEFTLTTQTQWANTEIVYIQTFKWYQDRGSVCMGCIRSRLSWWSLVASWNRECRQWGSVPGKSHSCHREGNTAPHWPRPVSRSKRSHRDTCGPHRTWKLSRPYHRDQTEPRKPLPGSVWAQNHSPTCSCALFSGCERLWHPLRSNPRQWQSTLGCRLGSSHTWGRRWTCLSGWTRRRRLQMLAPECGEGLVRRRRCTASAAGSQGQPIL